MIAGLMLLIPLLGAALIPFLAARQAKWIALLATSITFVVSVIAASGFQHWHDGGFGLTGSVAMAPEFGVTLSTGADSVSMLLILLTTLLMPVCVLASYTAIAERLREYYGWMLVIESAMLGVFLARDLIFFYVCFELTLVPMFFLIAIYGGNDRARASYKFFIYTFTGSLIALAGLLYVAWRFAEANNGWSFDIATLTAFAPSLTPKEQAWVLLAMMAGFAVKVPLFPVHTWLPLAHTEAPTAGSVILAGVLLKLGTYGLYRFVLPMVPAGVVSEVAVWWWTFKPIHLVAVVSIIGILYAALVCWVQTDIKKLVAYSSVSHLGFCVLGLFALNPLGVQGSVLYMLNHGLSTGALFLLIGMIYERYHTRDMDQIGGLSRRMPVWAFFMVFFVLSSVGLPGLNGFVSEFYCLIGAFTASRDNATWPGMLGPWYAAFAAAGMIFAAMYLLMMTGKVVWGPLKEPPSHRHHHDREHGAEHGRALPHDLTLREIGVLTPLALACVWLGVQSPVVTDTLQRPIDTMLVAYPALIEQPRVVQHPTPAPARMPPVSLSGADVDG
jgi:NADH-quinone oxidoreductase subunit M